jgi:1-acyl-sn-glycerol-3-phosphate acyltransferase
MSTPDAPRRAKDPIELKAMRVTARAVTAVGRGANRVSRMRGRVAFPLAAPTVPATVEVPAKPKTTGAAFETDWARRPLARATRTAIVEGPLRLAIRAVAAPKANGLDRLADLKRAAERAGDDGADLPVIFAANHHSHLDAPLLLTSVPLPWRRKLVVGAAADYFFGTRLTGSMSALALGAIPIERQKVNRASAQLALDLVADGWSIVIFPEGGRSPDGWGQPFKGGAAFLSVRSGAPVVPIHVEGTGSIWGKGARRITPGTTRVTFGAPLRPEPGEDARRMGDRIEAAVAQLGDEVLDGWWVARSRAARGTTTPLAGPGGDSWRRSWALHEQRRRGGEGVRRRQRRPWPKV